MASPTAKYNEPQSVFEAPADVVFLCSCPNELSKEDAEALIASGCKTVVDGGYRPVSSQAAEVNGVYDCMRACMCRQYWDVFRERVKCFLGLDERLLRGYL